MKRPKGRPDQSHAATRGSVNVLSNAPYGYRYISKREGDGVAAFEINDEHAVVVKQIFEWVGRDRISIGEVKRRLDAKKIHSYSPARRRTVVAVPFSAVCRS